MSDTNLVPCYNKGCGRKYDPKDNKTAGCSHHPGVPVFHDALKGWSCCKKRSTDFTEFLNIPGCTVGPHSNKKAPEQEKTDNGEVAGAPEVVRPPMEEPQPRPSSAEPLIRLSHIVGRSLQQALEKQMRDVSLDGGQEKSMCDADTVKEGTPCKNPGCNATYTTPNTDTQTCVYHQGVPVFHEGLKYWSCCQRKTSDFNSFLNQEGCTSGKHMWFKKETEAQKVSCRVDWHQTAQFVTISVFAKVSNPDKSCVETNKVQTKLCIIFEDDKKYDKTVNLHGVIDPSRSSVKMLGTKIEVNLRKTEPGLWPRLELQNS